MAIATVMGAPAFAKDMVVGFSQVGSESGWRAAETAVTKQEAEKRGIDLKFADAQQKQENQIKAIRSFVRRASTRSCSRRSSPPAGTTSSKRPRKPRSRRPARPQHRDLRRLALPHRRDLDQVHEGKVAGDYLVKEVGSKPCNVVELQGTTGSSPAIARKKGFEEAIKGHDNIKLTRSQTGDFTRTKGKEVMESFIKARTAARTSAPSTPTTTTWPWARSRPSRKPA